MLPFNYRSFDFEGLANQAASSSEFSVLWGRLLPSFALDISSNECCGWTCAELHSYLIDGITVGGHTIQDEDIVRNVKVCWDEVGHYDGDASSILTLNYVGLLHSVLMKGLLPVEKLGSFRLSPVTISGSDEWVCVPAERLRECFLSEIDDIKAIANPVEKAIIAQLWISYRQFFADGNKRVARMLTNSLLAVEQVGIFAVPHKGHSEFTRLLCDFYNTADATLLCRFIVKYCLHTFDGNGLYRPPAAYTSATLGSLDLLTLD